MRTALGGLAFGFWLGGILTPVTPVAIGAFVLAALCYLAWVVLVRRDEARAGG